MKTTFVFLCVIVVVLSNQEALSDHLKKREILLINTGQLDIHKSNSSVDVVCTEDDTLIYAKYIASRLRKIEDKRQRLLCEHLIESTLYKALLGELTGGSQISEGGGQPYRQSNSYVPLQNGNNNVPPMTMPTPPPTPRTFPPITTPNPNLPYLLYTKTGQIPPEERQRLRKIHVECEEDPITYVDEALLKKLRVYKDDRQVQIHMFCMGEKAGLIRKDGTIDEEFSKRSISYVIQGEEAVNEVYRKCAIEKRNKEETITYYWLCLILEGTDYYAKLN